MKVEWIRCSNCGQRMEASAPTCPRCNTECLGREQQPYSKVFKAPENFEVIGCVVQGKFISLAHAINTKLIEQRNLLQSTWAVLSPRASVVLQAIVEVKYNQ